MEQKSNVQSRAEKEYKNSREKFFLLLREIISNAIHAVLIRETKEDGFIPELKLSITLEDTQCKIELRDNGEGFTEENRGCFEELDKINQEKKQHNFHPLGQGRLSLIYFADEATYETVYKDEDGIYHKRTIPYPKPSEGMFNFTDFDDEKTQLRDSYTTLTVLVNKQNTLGRAKTFFKSCPDVNLFKQWFIETFFPFIVNNDKLVVNISFNGNEATIRRDRIEAEIKPKPFDIQISGDSPSNFKLWLLKSGGQMHGDNPIICFARNLKAELSNGKLKYSIDNEDGCLLYLTSDYFDEYVDRKGERIEISSEDILKINEKINAILDDEFRTVIENNKNANKRNLINFKKKYPSLEIFVKEGDMEGKKNVVGEGDIIRAAIDAKSVIEKKFWNQVDEEPENGEVRFSDSEECHKLLNSSLHIYVRHRESVLNRLHTLIQMYGADGQEKPELEKTVHELLMKRGVTLKDSSDINHLHNLWILDDKFTIFSNDFKAKSTKQGQPLSDIYLWADAPEQTKEVLILELKSTTNAHNKGSMTEGMIAQVKRYAQNFYSNPRQSLNWDVETDKVQYIGIILARKSDINKELQSNNVSGFKRIPFLKNSYYADDSFARPKSNDPMDKVAIRMEVYSYEDIYELASSRNKVFFNLLKREFEVVGDDE